MQYIHSQILLSAFIVVKELETPKKFNGTVKWIVFTHAVE